MKEFESYLKQTERVFQSIYSVEQHWYCDRCGFMVEQAYSIPFECFSDRKKGFKDYKGVYHSKNVKKHKRIRRKCNYDKKIEINPTWSMYV